MGKKTNSNKKGRFETISNRPFSIFYNLETLIGESLHHKRQLQLPLPLHS